MYFVGKVHLEILFSISNLLIGFIIQKSNEFKNYTRFADPFIYEKKKTDI